MAHAQHPGSAQHPSSSPSSGSAVSPVGSAHSGAAAVQGGPSERPQKERAGAIIVDKNRAQSKRLSRVLSSAGYTTKTLEEDSAPALGSLLSASPEINSWLLLADAAAAQTLYAVLNRPDVRRSCRGLVYCGIAGSTGAAPPAPAAAAPTASTEDVDIAALCEQSGVLGLLNGRQGRDFDLYLLAVANYLRGQPLLPLQGFLLWGAAAYSTQISNVAGRDAAEARIVKLCTDQLGVSSRIANSVGEVIHELLTNAMYDAPVDAQGRAIYSHDRTAPIQLNNEDRVTFRYGTDGTRLVVETADRFGRLRRSDFVRSLRRAAAGQVNRSAGGAGIGLSMIYRTANVLQVDVDPGQRTRVTAVFDLDSARATEGARATRTVIFPDLTIASARRDP